MNKTIFLRTLSPVFIGSGAQMEPFEYFFDQSQQVLYRIAPDAIFRQIFDKHPEAIEHIHTWIEENAQTINNEKDNEKQSRLRSEFTIFNFVRRKLKDRDLATELERQMQRAHSACIAFRVNRSVASCAKRLGASRVSGWKRNDR